MGRTIQFGSQAVALAIVSEMEHNCEILEYWDQPEPITLRYTAPDGRRRGLIYRPDYFVIERDAAGWLECKPDAQLSMLAAQMPNRYVGAEGGQWLCPPGHAYAAKFGLFYHVVSDRRINWTFQRNLRFLEDYFNDEGCTVTRATQDRAVSTVAGAPGITLATLLNDSEIRPADVYTMIAAETLYTDLSIATLTEPDRVKLFPTRDMADAYVNAAV